MARVTREESQAETRARLIEAAAAEFADRGFGGASLDRIVDAAGFTRGAVYSNFEGKTDLFIAVLDHRLDAQFDEVATIIDAAGARSAGFLERLRSPRWTGRNAPAQRLRWMLLYDEFRLFALRNPDARRRLADHEERLRSAYADAADAFLDVVGLAGAFSRQTLGAMLFALDHDLNRQELIDPEHVPVTSFADSVSLLLEAMEAIASQRGSDQR